MSAKSVLRRACEIYLILFASFHLLFFDFSGYVHIFETKVLSFCLINIPFIILTIVMLFLAGRSGSVLNIIKRKISLSHICVFLYFLFTLISALLSSHFPQTVFGVSRFEGLFTTALYCFTFFAVSFIPCRLDKVFITFCISVSLLCVVCIIQFFGFNPFSLYPDGMNFYDAGRLYTTAFAGTIGNTNLLGAFICIALPLITVILIKAKTRLRFLLLIPVLLLTITAVKMDVDSTILALIIVFIITLPFIIGFGKKKSIIYFGILLLLGLCFILFIYFCPPPDGMLKEASEILHGNISETFGSGRIRIWKNVISEISDSPVFGKGPDTMLLENFKPFSRYYPALGKVKTASIDVAHNEPLNILYHQGILGLTAYLGFIIFTLITWWKNKSNTTVLALGVAFICYFLQSLFTFSMCLSAPYFWICAGLIVGISNKSIKEPTLE